MISWFGKNCVGVYEHCNRLVTRTLSFISAIIAWTSVSLAWSRDYLCDRVVPPKGDPRVNLPAWPALETEEPRQKVSGLSSWGSLAPMFFLGKFCDAEKR